MTATRHNQVDLGPYVIDTNVLLDIFVFEDPALVALRAAFFAGQLDAVFTAQTAAEFEQVLARSKFRLSAERQQNILKRWLALARRIEAQSLPAAPWRCKDQDDQIFLDLAFFIKPCTLLSKDKQVLRFGKRAIKEGVVIQPPAVVWAS